MGDKRKVFREGQKFGKLLAIRYMPVKKYLCRCDCGNEKIFHTSHLISGDTISCGCIRSIQRENYDECIRHKILNSIGISKSGCWEWKKARHRQGYGNIGFKGKVMLAHRVSWMVFKGDLDLNILVCHHCDNPPCVNPDHLFLGTDQDNVKDGFSKGRIKRHKGENHPEAKLTEEIVTEIRRLAAEGMQYADISKKLNVRIGNISGIVTRTSWKHI